MFKEILIGEKDERRHERVTKDRKFTNNDNLTIKFAETAEQKYDYVIKRYNINYIITDEYHSLPRFFGDF